MAEQPIVRRVPIEVLPPPGRRGAPRWQETPEPQEQSVLLEHADVLWRRRRWVMGFALAGLLAGYALTLPQVPVYRARTSVDVQDLNDNFLNMRAVDPTAMPSNSGESNLQTQVKLLQSDVVLDRVVKRLATAPGPATVPAHDALSQWRAQQGWPTEPIRREDILHHAATSVKVKPLGMTRLIEITCDAPEPKMAAQFCNTLTSEFIQRSFEVRLDNMRQTSEWLATQMADVRAKLERDEQKLQSYTQANSMFYNQERDSVGQERLRQVQAELSRAQADRVARQAQYEMHATHRADPNTLPVVLDSGPLKEYQLKLADLRRRHAELSAAFTPEYHLVRKVRAEMAEVEASVQRERANVLGRLKNEYEAARHREALLTKAYNDQERVVSGQSAHAAQYNMLKREVDTGRQLYETLLSRGREAGLATAMRTSTVRVVDPARVPEAPIAPRPLFSGAAGLIAGCLLGAAAATMRERRDRSLRVPRDVLHFGSARTLGVVPSTRLEPGGRRALPRPRGEDGPLALTAPEGTPVAATRQRLELATWSSRPSLVAESYRMVMSSLLFATEEGPAPQVIVVTSPGVNEGKTTLVSNLGIALAETKRRVALIDGDLRRPRLHEIFGLSNDDALRQVLRGEMEAGSVPLRTVVQSTFVPGLSLVTSGRGGSERIASLLHSPHLPTLLDRLRKEFDIILIDSPPMLQLADARLLGHRSDGVVLVFRAGSTTRDTAEEAQRFFAADGTRVLGTVLNDFQGQGDNSRYRGYYQYLRKTNDA